MIMKKILPIILLTYCVNILGQTRLEFQLVRVCIPNQLLFGSKEITDFARFKGLPQSCQVRIFEFKQNETSVHMLLFHKAEFLYGLKIDANCNQDFVDDYEYNFFLDQDSLSTNAHINQQILFTPQILKLKAGNQWIYPGIDLKNGMNFENIRVYIGSSTFYYSNLIYKNKKYTFLYDDGEYEKRYIVIQGFNIINSSTDLSTLLRGKHMIPLKFETHENKYLFHVDSIDINSEKNHIIVQDIGNGFRKISPYKGFFAPSFKSQDINGNHYSLTDFVGSYVIIDFWGTWCHPCIAALPTLHKLYNKYRKNVIFVSVASDLTGSLSTFTNKCSLISLIRRYDMRWINFYEKNPTNSSAITSIYNIQAFPTTVLIDPQGKIIFRGNGINALKDIEDILARIQNRL